jgi:hypothetical protein
MFVLGQPAKACLALLVVSLLLVGCAAQRCSGGCLCYSVDECPKSCTISQGKQPDGGTFFFCDN